MSDIPWDRLIEQAVRARDHAWAPYSKFSVGAALLAGGDVYASCNVENASFPVGICAERGALCAAVGAGKRKMEALVVVAGPMIPPCGMCRQALSEFGDMKVLLVGLDGEQRSETTLSALLPGPFSL